MYVMGKIRDIRREKISWEIIIIMKKKKKKKGLNQPCVQLFNQLPLLKSVQDPKVSCRNSS